MSIVQFYQQQLISLQSELSSIAELLDSAIEQSLQADYPNIHNIVNKQCDLLGHVKSITQYLNMARALQSNEPGNQSEEQIRLIHRIFVWFNGEHVTVIKGSREDVVSLTNYLCILLDSIQSLEIAYGEKLYELDSWFDDMLDMWRDAKKLYPTYIAYIEDEMV